MSTVTARIKIGIKVNEVLNPSGSNGNVGTLALQISELADYVNNLADSGSNALKAYIDTQEGVGASQNQDYDLIGSLSDNDGGTINFDEVYWIIVWNRSSTYALTLGPGATNSFGVGSGNQGFWADASDKSYIPPLSPRVLASAGGVPAAAGSTDNLRLSTLGGSSANAWSILIIGRDNA